VFPFALPSASSAGAAPVFEMPPDDGVSTAASLRSAGEALATVMTKGLQTMAGPAVLVEGRLEALAKVTSAEAIAARRPECVIGSILVGGTEAMILAVADGAMVHALVELLCGGTGSEPIPATLRPATLIDQQFVQTLFQLTCSSMQSEWGSDGFETARAAKIDGLLTPDMFGAKVDEVFALDMAFVIFGWRGTLRLFLPPAMLSGFDAEAPSLAMIEPEPADDHWASGLAQAIGQAPVALKAYLDANAVPLSMLADLQVGQVLPLPPDARSRASLVSGEAVLYRGELGRDDDRYSLRIDQLVDERADKSARSTRQSPRRIPFYDLVKD
jgi:flagellar motor switch protein FliM